MASVLPDGAYQESVEETFTQDDLLGIDNETENKTVLPTKTWKMCLRTQRIVESINDEEALEQFVFKALRTARYRYRIFDGEYGSEIISLIGSNLTKELVEAEIPRKVEDALIYDDRILVVRTTNTRREGDKLYVDIELDTIYGVKYFEGISLSEEV